MILASLSSETISSSSEEAYSLHEKSSFGEKKAGRIIYSDFEALYLVEKNKMHVMTGSKKIDFHTLISKMRKKNRKIEINFAVYSNLRQKGYILKEALKFGADFRAYEPGTKPGTSHAPWLIHSTTSTEKVNWHEFTSKVRVSHSTKKKLLVAIVDSESAVSYYEIDWKKL